MDQARFDIFFRQATASAKETSGLNPFDYQRRLACGERGGRTDDAWLSGGTDCRSLLLNVPTGCGKTAAVVLAWLWNRIKLQRSDWPRRLVYCLPMRTLVEQTRGNVQQWLRSLATSDAQGSDGDLAWLKDNSPVVLMGGEDAEPGRKQWDIWPEQPAIIIGTQDMLLSRALNRGYGMSRYRWPMHFGLLNDDCLWVFDEVQLMGAGLPTTTQLDGFRKLTKAERNCHSIWMSATLESDWLRTIDFDPVLLGDPVPLSSADKSRPGLRERFSTPTPIERCVYTTNNKLADQILATAEQADGLTLVVLNTVRRAQELHDQLRKLVSRQKSALPLTLIHSRFRSLDRAKHVSALLGAEGRPGIVVSTQVVEAGVDVSAARLFTALAPWASIVQRFGRCNRRGLDPNARIFWIDVEDKDAAPYDPDDLGRARQRLEGLSDASLASLARVLMMPEDKPRTTHVIRRKDLVELFDTTADLAGNDLDIDRYVREAEDSSVQVFWREWEGKVPLADMPAGRREELCPVLVNEFLEFWKKLKPGDAWRWDYLEREWSRIDRVFPGQMYLLRASTGGYSAETGWDPKSARVVAVVPQPADGKQGEGYGNDPLCHLGVWQSIAEHTDEVCRELEAIVTVLKPVETPALRHTARWHDRGKRHDVFEDAVMTEQNGVLRPADWLGRRDVAKAPRADKTTGHRSWWRRYQRKHFRHELASALAILDPSTPLPDELRALVAYLAAAHHGKVRLSIRSLPDEKQPNDGIRFARGVWHGDRLAQTDLGAGVVAPPVTLSLELMEIGLCEEPPFAGEASWADRMLRLRDTLGPFRLAFLESLIRAADERASAKAAAGGES